MSIISFQKIIELTGQPKGVLHGGAYLGDDVLEYTKNDILNVLYVEPNPILFRELKIIVGEKNCVEKALYNQDDLELDFHLYYSKDRTNLGCSSLFEWSGLKENKYIEECGKIKVQTVTIDTLLKNRPDIDFLNMDIQGGEIQALLGATKVLPQINCILTEFSIKADYKNACLLTDLDDFLLPKGFVRVITEFATQSWGDAVFLKRYCGGMS